MPDRQRVEGAWKRVSICNRGRTSTRKPNLARTRAFIGRGGEIWKKRLSQVKKREKKGKKVMRIVAKGKGAGERERPKERRMREGVKRRISSHKRRERIEGYSKKKKEILRKGF